MHYEPIDMDDRNKAVYQKVLKDFQEWYQRAQEEARAEYKEVKANEILVHLTALIGCASFPQLIDEAWRESGEPTSKQKRLLELVEQYVGEGRKVIVLSRSKAGARWIRDKIDKMGHDPVFIDGGVSLTWYRKTWTPKRMHGLEHSKDATSSR